MSNYLGDAVVCQQCEAEVVISAGSREEFRARLEELGWAPYGTGVTPLAEENAQRGDFSCPRCTTELVEQRLNRIAGEAMKGLRLEHAWLVIRDQNSPNDHLRIKRRSDWVQIPFEHRKTDREMREELTKSISNALSAK